MLYYTKEGALQELKRAIKGSKFESHVFLVGGSVRDPLLNRESRDIDLLVTLPKGGLELSYFLEDKYPRDVKINFTSEKHGYASITFMGHEIDLSDSPPPKGGIDSYEIIQESSSQRDFTVNALFKDLSGGAIMDPSRNGLEDLHAHIIRSVGDPYERFTEDPIRILRAVRLASELGFTIDKFTLKEMKECSGLLKEVAKKRVAKEMVKICLCSDTKRAFILLSDIGVLRILLPEIEGLRGVTQNDHHHEDVFFHTLSVMEKCPPQLSVRMSALFHDCGKLSTKRIKDGKVTFHGHEKESAKICEEVLSSWAFPEENIEKYKKIIMMHMRLKSSGEYGTLISQKALKKFNNDANGHLYDILKLIHADNLSHASESCLPHQVAGIKKRIREIGDLKSDKVILPISGWDLIEKGLEGPAIGKALDKVKSEIQKGNNLSKQEALKLINLV